MRVRRSEAAYWRSKTRLSTPLSAESRMLARKPAAA
jgi:hypothetical protein